VAVFAASGRAGRLWGAAHGDFWRFDGAWDAGLGLRTGECRGVCDGFAGSGFGTDGYADIFRLSAGMAAGWELAGVFRALAVKIFPYYLVNGMKDTCERTERPYSVRYNGGIQSDCYAWLRNRLVVLGIRYSGSTWGWLK
jgi:hypothetical protein